VVCLNCARRMVSPKRLGTKYSPLSRYLLHRGMFTDHVALPFAEIEGIIGDNLPFGAVRDSEWWANARGSAQGRAWIDVGWIVEDIDLKQRAVTFKRVAERKIETETTPKKSPISKAFTRKPITAPRRKKPIQPSKTRISKAQARMLNLLRQRESAQLVKGKFKPKPAHEKRLFKAEAKPSDVADA